MTSQNSTQIKFYPDIPAGKPGLRDSVFSITKLC
jgi:hypothetical protein